MTSDPFGAHRVGPDRDGPVTDMATDSTALVGAVLGGLAGMRYHRGIDRAGFDE
jgi:hypothetical protein